MNLSNYYINNFLMLLYKNYYMKYNSNNIEYHIYFSNTELSKYNKFMLRGLNKYIVFNESEFDLIIIYNNERVYICYLSKNSKFNDIEFKSILCNNNIPMIIYEKFIYDYKREMNNPYIDSLILGLTDKSIKSIKYKNYIEIISPIVVDKYTKDSIIVKDIPWLYKYKITDIKLMYDNKIQLTDCILNKQHPNARKIENLNDYYVFCLGNIKYSKLTENLISVILYNIKVMNLTNSYWSPKYLK